MTLRHERGVTESFFIKPTTAAAVREAGVQLSEDVDNNTPLRVVCMVAPQGPDLVHAGFGVQARRKDGRWEVIMRDLPPGPEDDANVDWAESVFAATDEEEREMLRLARQASQTVAAVGQGGGAQN